MKWANLGWVAAGAAAFLPVVAAAQTAVLVEAGNQRLRDDLQWLVDREVIQLSTSSWPMPLSILEEALSRRRQEGLSAGDRAALVAVEREVARLGQPLGYGLSVQANTASVPATGFESPVLAKAQLGGWVQGSNDKVAGKLQLRRLHQPLTDRQSETSLEGSYLATELGGQILYAGQLAHWWGPGQDGSLAWSNAAPAIPGIGLRRGSERPFETRWLSWLGPWSYEVFLGRMQHNALVPGARTFGLRLHAQPVRGLEVGISRQIHWGGPVDDSPWNSLVGAVLGDPNRDLSGGPKSNEVGGVDVRYTLPVQGNPLTLYGQFVGEEMKNKLPSSFMGLLGVEFKHVVGNTRLHWHLESADTTARRVFGTGTGFPGMAYTHMIYRDGFYHSGLPIGHFIGGDGRAVSLGLTLVPQDSPRQLRHSFRVVKADVNPGGQTVNLAFPRQDDVTVAEYAASWQMPLTATQPLNVRLGLTTVHSERNGNDTGLLLGLELPVK